MRSRAGAELRWWLAARARGGDLSLSARLHRPPRRQIRLHRPPLSPIALHGANPAFTDRRSHRVPGFDSEWRARVVEAWSASAASELRDGSVYWESIGPRFETPAEIRLIAEHADVIGMTIASECVIAGELGLPYAAICIVDNLANGVGERELTVDEFQAGRARNRDRLSAAVAAVLPELGRGDS